MEKVGVELQVQKRREFSRDMGLAARDVRGVGAAADATGRDFRKLDGKVGRSGGVLSKFKQVGMGAVLAVGAAAAGAAAAGVHQLVAGFRDMAEMQRLEAQTSQTIKTMGGAAGVSAKDIRRMADETERLTGIEAEQITVGLNMLLTFSKIRNGAGKDRDIFNQASKAVTDLSVLMGTDAQSAAIQLGKALQDPARGAAAMGKAGTIAKDDIEKLKKMSEAGVPLWKQQQYIINAVNKQAGGQAEAFGKTTAGMAAKASNAWGDLRESVAEALEPTVRKWLPKATKAIQDFAPKAAAWVKDDLVPALQRLGDWWNDNSDTIITGAKLIGKVIGAMVKQIGGTITGVTTVINAGIDLALMFGDKVIGVLQGGLNAVLTVADKTLGVLSGLPGPTGRKFAEMRETVRGFRVNANEELDRVRKEIRIAADARAANKELDAMLARLNAATAHDWEIEATVRAGNAAAQAPRTPRRRRARGGSVLSGTSYLVGEQGPEVLTMGRTSPPGYVSANAGASIVVNGPLIDKVVAAAGESPEALARRLAPALVRQINVELATQ